MAETLQNLQKKKSKFHKKSLCIFCSFSIVPNLIGQIGQTKNKKKMKIEKKIVLIFLFKSENNTGINPRAVNFPYLPCKVYVVDTCVELFSHLNYVRLLHRAMIS